MPAVELVKSDGMEDWYTIEKKEHDHKGGLVSDGPNSSMYIWSGRISDADVEGTAEEMLDIAKAIKERGFASHKRCQVKCVGDLVLLRSPRNSQVDGSITLKEADDLAQDIIEKLADGFIEHYKNDFFYVQFRYTEEQEELVTKLWQEAGNKLLGSPVRISQGMAIPGDDTFSYYTKDENLITEFKEIAKSIFPHLNK